MPVSKRVRDVGASMTLAMSARAGEMRAGGANVINLSAGEPDFPTPPAVVDAARAFCQAGQVKYTAAAGTPELRDAVASIYAERHGIDIERGNVVVNCGAKHSLYVALQVLCDEGDEVVFASPYWVSYPEMAKLASAVPVPVPTRAEAGFQLEPDALAAALTDRTRVIVLNSPSNPTGAVTKAEYVTSIAEMAVERDIWILSDEIYDQLCYGGVEAVSPMSLGPDVRSRTIVTNGVSKTYSMTGWRIGYAVGPAEIIDAMVRLQSHETSNPSTVGQVAALAAITGDQSVVAERRVIFEQRRRLMLDGLRSIPELECDEPQGAFYVFPKASALYGRRSAGGDIGGSLDLSMRILEEANVATVPGVAFGDDDHIRLSYATSEEDIEEALRRIRVLTEGLS
jgi:aspartate aminotransferase